MYLFAPDFLSHILKIFKTFAYHKNIVSLTKFYFSINSKDFNFISHNTNK